MIIAAIGRGMKNVLCPHKSAGKTGRISAGRYPNYLTGAGKG